MSITNEQLMLLDNLIYLNETVVNNMLNKSAKEFEEAVTDKQFYYCKNMVNGMDVVQWKDILNAIAADEKLMNMTITNICAEAAA